eukprot:2092828-Rhodomonas_salina.3
MMMMMMMRLPKPLGSLTRCDGLQALALDVQPEHCPLCSQAEPVTRCHWRLLKRVDWRCRRPSEAAAKASSSQDAVIMADQRWAQSQSLSLSPSLSPSQVPFLPLCQRIALARSLCRSTPVPASVAVPVAVAVAVSLAVSLALSLSGSLSLDHHHGNQPIRLSMSLSLS